MKYKPKYQRLSHLIFALVLVLTSSLAVLAQQPMAISGVIVSPENEPIANVSVSVEGSKEMPAITDEQGKFTVNASLENQWINIAPAFEYKRKRVFLAGRTELTVMLTPLDLTSGADEVIILNQVEKRKNVAASFTSLDLDDVKKNITPSIDNYMQGRIAGVHTVKRTGDPGTGSFSYMRGINSLNANTQPLYIVDGVIMQSQGLFNSMVDGFAYNPLLSVNTTDISNAIVFKDAVYSAAYGSKASNGLVMISTLDPSATETSFEIDYRSGISLKPERYIKQLNAQQYKTLANELINTSGELEEILIEQYPNLYVEEDDIRYIDYLHDTDWQPYIFDDAMFNSFNVKVKGGDEIARYGLSFGYYNNNGITKNTNYEGYNIRFVSLVNIYTWLRMNASVSFNTNNSIMKESAVVSETNPILSSLAKSPLLSPYQYDSEGVLNENILSDVDEFGISNPLATIDNFEANNQNYNIVTALGFEIDLPKDFLLSTNVGITYNALKENLFMPNKGMELYYDDEAHNVAKASTNTFNGFSNNTMLIYNKVMGDHVINSTTGMNMLSNKYEYDWGIGKNAHENDEYRNIQDGIENLREKGGENRNWNWISFYEKASYSYRDKYLATAILSFDGSSRIGRNAANTVKLFNNPFGIFYSAGLGWRISNESFMDDLNWIDELKIRASFGRNGNDDIGETNASNFYRNIMYRETTGVYPSTLSNTELTYEFVDKLNAGVDMGLFGNRLRLSFDFYQTNISNMLIYQPLEAYFGYEYRPENNGAMQNTGWDANAFVRLINTPSFKWDIEANVSSTKNKITEIENNRFISDYGSYELVNEVGATANSFYGYQFKGVYSNTAEAQEANLVNDKGIAYKAGDAIFEDISGANGEADGIINQYDKTVIGSPMPDFVGGLTNTFSYKNWTLSAFVNFVSGSDAFNYIRYKNESMTDFSNQSSYTLNRWQREDQVTNVPAASWNDPIGNSAFSSRWIEDASYLRLQNVSLSYKIPHEFLAFKNAEFYVSASNLITLSNYLGYDPEFAYSYSLGHQGVDFGQTPRPRQFLVGIKIGL